MKRIVLTDAWLKFNVHFLHQRMTMRRYMIQSVESLKTVFRPGTKAGRDSVFWALRGISLEVSDGDVVGLIGHNGAGKSTLLMMLAGIYTPDRGTISVQGRIGALLSLGAGFENELTGYENIRMFGTFVGWNAKTMDKRCEDIIEFADIDRFIDAPLKTYSSGMRARLGFSLAIHMDPDILLMDEVMAAGDAAFQQKAGNLIQHFHEQGKTIVMASHSMATIERECTQAVLLDHGQVVAAGPTDQVLSLYKERSRT